MSSGTPFDECQQLKEEDRAALKLRVMSSSDELLKASSDAANRVAALKHQGFSEDSKPVQDYQILVLGPATSNQLRTYRSNIVAYDNQPGNIQTTPESEQL